MHILQYNRNFFCQHQDNYITMKTMSSRFVAPIESNYSEKVLLINHEGYRANLNSNLSIHTSEIYPASLTHLPHL